MHYLVGDLVTIDRTANAVLPAHQRADLTQPQRVAQLTTLPGTCTQAVWVGTPHEPYYGPYPVSACLLHTRYVPPALPICPCCRLAGQPQPRELYAVAQAEHAAAAQRGWDTPGMCCRGGVWMGETQLPVLNAADVALW
jgi:hypothetical protein